jgi:hypothetical protein
MIQSLLLATALSGATSLQPGELDSMAVKLFRTDDSITRKQLLAIPKAELQRASNAFRVDINKEPERAAAVPYALALANIDLPKNLGRMRAVYMAFESARRKNSDSRAKLMDVTDYLSGSYARIWASSRNPLAVKFLWAMALDGGLSEGQAIFAFKCFELAPHSFLQAVRMQAGIQAIGFGIEFQDLARTNPSEYRRLIGVLRQNTKKSGRVGSNARVILGSMPKS